MYFSLILLPGNKRNVACAHRFKGETDESCPSLDVNGLSRSFVGLAHIWAERGFGGGIKLGPFRYLNGLSKSLVGLAHIWAERGFGGGIKPRPFRYLTGLSKSLFGLAHIWAERGFGGGIKLGP